MVSFSFESSYDDVEHKQAELWWATLDQLLMRLQQKRAVILQWDNQLPSAPQNRFQEFAKIYRDGQLSILGDVIGDLEGFLQPLEEGAVDMIDLFRSMH